MKPTERKKQHSNTPVICATAVLITAVGTMVGLIAYYHQTLTKMMTEDDGPFFGDEL